MSSLDAAAAALDAGGIVAVGTETVYGLVARIDRPVGVERIFAVKGRSRDAPFQVMFASLDDALAWAEPGPAGRAIATAHLPGPLTLVCRAARPVPDLGGFPGTIGLRVPAHPGPAALVARCGPLAGSSANRTGSPTPATMAGVRAVFGGEVDAYLDMPPTPAGSASSVVDVTEAVPRIVREGAISRAAIARSAGVAIL